MADREVIVVNSDGSYGTIVLNSGDKAIKEGVEWAKSTKLTEEDKEKYKDIVLPATVFTRSKMVPQSGGLEALFGEFAVCTVWKQEQEGWVTAKHSFCSSEGDDQAVALYTPEVTSTGSTELEGGRLQLQIETKGDNRISGITAQVGQDPTGDNRWYGKAYCLPTLEAPSKSGYSCDISCTYKDGVASELQLWFALAPCDFTATPTHTKQAVSHFVTAGNGVWSAEVQPMDRAPKKEPFQIHVKDAEMRGMQGKSGDGCTSEKYGPSLQDLQAQSLLQQMDGAKSFLGGGDWEMVKEDKTAGGLEVEAITPNSKHDVICIHYPRSATKAHYPGLSQEEFDNEIKQLFQWGEANMSKGEIATGKKVPAKLALLSCSVEEGSSGAPVINNSGKVVGLVAGARTSANCNWAALPP